MIFCYIFFSAHCKIPQLTQSTTLFNDAAQLVVVLSPDSSSTSGKLTKFDKKDGKWVPSGIVHDVSLGRTGLAWGSGLHEESLVRGLPKREGDGKSPAGFFKFGPAFGYAPAAEVHLKWPYIQATSTLECVDDGHHPLYNQLVDNQKMVKDWSSSEMMLRQDHQYRWGVVVEHNIPAKSMGGSCIFFHIWSAPGSPTAGCTAMAEENLLQLMQWLDPTLQPVLVQLTETDYRQLAAIYGLPM